MNNKQKQMQLKYLGYYVGQIDGSIGSITKRSIKVFQKSYNLNIDGIFGSLTISKSIIVWKDIQRLLNKYNNSSIIEDGYVGNNTITQIKIFQANNLLAIDGICGIKTRNKLYEYDKPIIVNDDICNFSTIKNFKRNEFICGCRGKYCNGFPTEMKQSVVDVADRARQYFNKPATVSSGLRCQVFNDSLARSIKDSLHIKGKAIDMSIAGISGKELYNYLLLQKEVRYVYIIEGSWVHFNT
ncbi:MAG: peptidoglycan-binding protein [Bacilli bacterium]